MTTFPFLLLTAAHLTDDQLVVTQSAQPTPRVDRDLVDQLGRAGRLIATATYVAAPMTIEQADAWRESHPIGADFRFDRRTIQRRLDAPAHERQTLIRAALEAYPFIRAQPMDAALIHRLEQCRIAGVRAAFTQRGRAARTLGANAGDIRAR